MLIAIDPGEMNSALICYEHGQIIGSLLASNEKILREIEKEARENLLVIEDVGHFGLPVGKSVFTTVKWIGRFIQAWSPGEYVELPRRDVKLWLCNSSRAKDANIRQAVMDRFEPSGGGKNPVVGTTKQPGPLFGISKDLWSALAVAITYQEQQAALRAEVS